jgi:PAS domain-containing protein
MTILAGSIGLLCLSLFGYSYRAIFAARLVPSLLAALSVAVFLNFYSLWHLRNAHREADQAFRYTDCEFSSIFENVLDGILIVDNEGDCLDANPGAAAILRLSTNKLVGQNISRFFGDRDAFHRGWNTFLNNFIRRLYCRRELLAGPAYPNPLRRDGAHTGGDVSSKE